jgi:hypothetical protein
MKDTHSDMTDPMEPFSGCSVFTSGPGGSPLQLRTGTLKGWNAAAGETMIRTDAATSASYWSFNI